MVLLAAFHYNYIEPCSELNENYGQERQRTDWLLPGAAWQAIILLLEPVCQNYGWPPGWSPSRPHRRFKEANKAIDI